MKNSIFLIPVCFFFSPSFSQKSFSLHLRGGITLGLNHVEEKGDREGGRNERLLRWFVNRIQLFFFKKKDLNNL
jgi:hypothetical protein